MEARVMCQEKLPSKVSGFDKWWPLRQKSYAHRIKHKSRRRSAAIERQELIY